MDLSKEKLDETILHSPKSGHSLGLCHTNNNNNNNAVPEGGLPWSRNFFIEERFRCLLNDKDCSLFIKEHPKETLEMFQQLKVDLAVELQNGGYSECMPEMVLTSECHILCRGKVYSSVMDKIRANTPLN